MKTDETVDAIAEELTEDTTSHLETIETVISSLDHENTAMVSHTDDATIWKFQYGSVEVFVQLTGESDDDMLTVWSAVLKLPAKDELGLMRRLLEMNWSDTYEAAFCLCNDTVLIAHQRTVEGLSPSEISRAITLVATIADDNDELLKAEFGGS
ncbi:MAG: YbjN domain-containing protein [Cyanobacteria bacterium J083]|nr:MAG: YbjN domain-containing protein [Cyanobacteria bacterium J083]